MPPELPPPAKVVTIAAGAQGDGDGKAEGDGDGENDGDELLQLVAQICDALKQKGGMLAMELKYWEHDALKTAVLSKFTAVDAIVGEQRFGGSDVRRVLRLKNADVSSKSGWSQHAEIDVKRFPSRLRVRRDDNGEKMSPGSPYVVRRLSFISNIVKAVRPVKAPGGKIERKFCRKSSAISRRMLLNVSASKPVTPER